MSGLSGIPSNVPGAGGAAGADFGKIQLEEQRKHAEVAINGAQIGQLVAGNNVTVANQVTEQLKAGLSADRGKLQMLVDNSALAPQQKKRGEPSYRFALRCSK